MRLVSDNTKMLHRAAGVEAIARIVLVGRCEPVDRQRSGGREDKEPDDKTHGTFHGAASYSMNTPQPSGEGREAAQSGELYKSSGFEKQSRFPTPAELAVSADGNVAGAEQWLKQLGGSVGLVN